MTSKGGAGGSAATQAGGISDLKSSGKYPGLGAKISSFCVKVSYTQSARRCFAMSEWHPAKTMPDQARARESAPIAAAMRLANARSTVLVNSSTHTPDPMTRAKSARCCSPVDNMLYGRSHAVTSTKPAAQSFSWASSKSEKW
eukprot:CAMPEP_0117577884 /NCGR_PEP_ID=MMETSP0784-20121206/63670_1 /TAXON_ID=39447 /ORGANISM="" /LENGTH=142 /DNA_ID=CAMNT_0005377435 /DNA_START=1005 /DNA_END=1430 /DNA_ORIENTATION=-